MKSGISDNDENPLTTFRDATEREHAPSRRAKSVRDVREAFAAKANPDHWPSMCVLFYLQMPEIPAPLKPLALAAIDELAREVRQGRSED